MAASERGVNAEYAVGWESARCGRIDVYTYDGGARCAALLRLDRSGGTVLLNRRLMDRAGRQVAIGWALGVSETGARGCYLLVVDRAAGAPTA